MEGIVKVRPSSTRLFDEIALDDEKVYKNYTEWRGKAVIINNVSFDNNYYSDRDGTEVDVERLESLFRQLHYLVSRHDNLSAGGINQLAEWESRTDHSAYSSFIMVILSHGGENTVIGTDGYHIGYDQIMAHFEASKCPTLNGKPKMFFISTCPTGTTPVLETNPKRATALTQEEADMILVSSVTRGNTSWKTHPRGTLFIQFLVKGLTERAHDTDLMDILTWVNSEVSQMKTQDGCRQVSTMVRNTLRKRFYFWPGLYYFQGAATKAYGEPVSLISHHDPHFQITEAPPPDDSESHGSPDSNEAPPPDDNESHGSPDNDEGFMEKFRRLCESGKIPVYRQRVAVVGPYGVGKTHLVKRLIKAVYDKECDANTPGVKIYRHRCIVRDAGRSDWIKGKDDAENLFAQNMAIGLQKPETPDFPDQVRPAPASEPQPQLEDVNRETIPLGDSGSHVPSDRRAEKMRLKTVDHKILSAMEQGGAYPFGGSESDDSQGRAEERDLLKKIDPKLLDKIKKMAQGEPVEPEKQITIWDFGGQDVYYTTHQTFLSDQIIYLLVFRLDVDLDEKIPAFRGEKTVKEFILFWLNSIHMHTIGKLEEKDKNAIPYVLIIGTHKDQLVDQDDAIKKLINLREYLNKHPVLEEHVYNCLAINNLTEDDKEFDNIKREIENLCGYARGSEATVQEFSVSWIQLEMDLAKKSEVHPIITTKELCEMAERVGLPDGELWGNFIPEHHRQGEFLHFDVGELKNIMILDPRWLADQFSKIMTPAICESGEHPIDFLKYDLKRGVLRERVFEYLFSQEKCMMEKKDCIIQLMLHFNLMLDISGPKQLQGSVKRSFLVPSLLQSNDHGNTAFANADSTQILLISFPPAFFPLGLFHRLVVGMLKTYEPTERDCGIPVIGSDSASFCLEDEQSVLHLAIEEKAMKLLIENEITPPKPHIYSNARKTVENELSNLRDTYYPKKQFRYYFRMENGGDIFEMPSNVLSRGFIGRTVKKSRVRIDMTPYHVWFSGEEGAGEKGPLLPQTCPSLGNLGVQDEAATENQGCRAARCPENEYKNDSEPRGRALIINNKTFSKGWLKARYGSEADVDALEKLFAYLHYETHVISDLTKKEMEEEIEKESQRDDHKKYDSFILFLMSHGEKGAVYGTDGCPLTFDTIRKILNNKNCRGLCEKPKLIFIQACQGHIEDSGVFLDGQTVQQPQQSPPATSLGEELPDAPHEISQPSKVPTMADFLEFHATSPDYVSYRHGKEGTWFVQSIVDIFYRQAHEYDVAEMLVNVNKEISQRQTPKGKKQASEIVNRLRKKLFFNITRGEQE